MDRNIIFGDLHDPGAEPRVYQRVKDRRRHPQDDQDQEDYLDDYNGETTAPMKLVMFMDAIEHVSRICRVIRLPLGNALLLGVGGAGGSLSPDWPPPWKNSTSSRSKSPRGTGRTSSATT